ncbi:MAG: DUF2339 domain-containing protein [Spirochaetes bacterium]|nr:DUF2339 domain-containing protein [Spirochaetota bacterium]
MTNGREIGELRERIDLLQKELDAIRKKLDEEGTPAETAPAPAPRAPAPRKPSRAIQYLRTSVFPEFEGLVGGNILGKLGLLTLVLATAWFIKYAFDKQWINESGRIYTGLVFGFAMISYGLFLARGRLRIISHSIIGAGCAVVYVAIFGAYYFYDLVGREETFTALFILSACIALIASRADSQILYIFSLLGAFMAPILMSSGENSYRFLLSYLALVNAGFLAISLWRHWRLSPWLVLAADVLVYSLWAADNLSMSSFSVPFLFLIFIFVLFMARQLAVVPYRYRSLVTTDIILIPFVIASFTVLGTWAMNEFHRNLRPHFILSLAGMLAAAYFIFNRLAGGIRNEE